MINNEKYIPFVLGYDLLQKELKGNSEYKYTDIAYEVCCNITNDFLDSSYNVNTKSLYECLQDYLENEKEQWQFYLKEDNQEERSR